MCFTSPFLGFPKGNSKGNKECTAATWIREGERYLSNGSFFSRKDVEDLEIKALLNEMAGSLELVNVTCIGSLQVILRPPSFRWLDAILSPELM